MGRCRLVGARLRPAWHSPRLVTTSATARHARRLVLKDCARLQRALLGRVRLPCLAAAATTSGANEAASNTPRGAQPGQHRHQLILRHRINPKTQLRAAARKTKLETKAPAPHHRRRHAALPGRLGNRQPDRRAGPKPTQIVVRRDPPHPKIHQATSTQNGAASASPIRIAFGATKASLSSPFSVSSASAGTHGGVARRESRSTADR